MAQPQLQDILQALDGTRTQSGQKLAAFSEASPVLLLFLRHAGCTCCCRRRDKTPAFRPVLLLKNSHQPRCSTNSIAVS